MPKIYKNLLDEAKTKQKKIPKDTILPEKTYNRLQSKNLITLNEIKQYLDKGNKLTNLFMSKRKMIEINNAIQLLEKRHQIYKPINTNKQFAALYKTDVITQNQLSEMLVHFLGPMYARMVFILIEYSETDNVILDFIKQNQYFEKKNIANTLYKMTKIADSINNYTPRKFKLLDIGIGNGKKTLELKSLLECDIYGADIEQWGSYKKNRQFTFPYKTITLSPYHIPYEDKMFDCITLILVLHHCDNIIETINECKRLLKDDGIIVIIEHDVWTDESNMIIDLQHRIYAKLFNEQLDYTSTYYNFYEWDILFNKCDMEPIYVDRISEDVSFHQRYDLQFISIYKKSQ
jgi:ubiquinone/menaquinone biosynthesis C-methylase UbiE